MGHCPPSTDGETDVIRMRDHDFGIVGAISSGVAGSGAASRVEAGCGDGASAMRAGDWIEEQNEEGAIAGGPGRLVAEDGAGVGPRGR
jgi:hypothetical protein